MSKRTYKATIKLEISEQIEGNRTDDLTTMEEMNKGITNLILQEMDGLEAKVNIVNSELIEGEVI